LGRREEARAALEAAVAAAPRAWEDHGSRLRQFVAIEAALGGDLAWLDLLRPPLSLSWVGPGVDREMPGVAELIAGGVEQKRIGFALGPLAREADLAVAEAWLAQGVTLHLVLPGVPPTGERAEAVLSGAESIMQMRPLDGPPDLRRTLLARRIARGAARLNAERLMSEAVELQVIASDAAEEGEVGDDPRLPELSLLAISVGAGGEVGFETRLDEVGAAVAAAGPNALAPRLDGDDILIGYAGPEAAAAAARALYATLRGRMPLRIAGHHGFP